MNKNNKLKLKNLTSSSKGNSPIIKQGPSETKGKCIIENGESPNGIKIALDDPMRHSTPVRTKDPMNDLENSPEVEYHCSPIPMPCTQDGSNEVAWDWQGAEFKRQNNNKREQNVQDTPKRSNTVQKKRNLNSPLLRKPLKRKLMKRENIESIGKFTAELKALTENLIQKSHENHVKSQGEIENRLIMRLGATQLDSDMQILVDTKNPIQENADPQKENSLFQEFFDDAIEESLVRCSQEVEEHLNLYFEADNNNKNVPKRRFDRESSSNSESNIKFSTAPNFFINSSNKSSSDSSSVTNITAETKLCKSDQDSTTIKPMTTVSRTGSNNNNLSRIQKSASSKPSDAKNASNKDNGQFEFPDDSFDDIILTCVVEDKFETKPECTFNAIPLKTYLSPSKRRINELIVDSTKYQCTSSKQIKPDSQKSLCALSKNSNWRDSDYGSHNSDQSNDTIKENRKFFKTKSLSDSSFNGNNSPISKATNKPSNTKTSITRSSVSTNPAITSLGQNIPHSKSFPNNKMNDAQELNTNRFGGKEGGNVFVRHHSASSLGSNTKTTNGSQQPVRCTPEEIERKRLEAKMKLEMKRKLISANSNTTNVSKIPPKTCVKR